LWATIIFSLIVFLSLHKVISLFYAVISFLLSVKIITYVEIVELGTIFMIVPVLFTCFPLTTFMCYETLKYLVNAC